MLSEYHVVNVINEFATPVYTGPNQVARLSDNQLFHEAPYRLKQGTDTSEHDQLREVIRGQLEKLGINERTYISFRDPQEIEAGDNKLTFVYLGFLQQ